MKTAMNELFERFGHLMPDTEKEFLEKEKQQIIDAFESANSEIHNEDGSFKTGEQYYNETFKIKL